MKEFFLNLIPTQIYKWEDYFSIPMSEDALKKWGEKNHENIRTSSTSHSSKVLLPSSRAVGYLFVVLGSLRICHKSTDSKSFELSLKAGDFCKLPQGNYWIDYYPQVEIINMWFIEEVQTATDTSANITISKNLC